jgi:hypothetical protein
MINLVKSKWTKTSGIGIATGLTGQVILLACVVCFSSVSNSETQDGANAAALAQLRGLAGEWEGSFEWTGGRTATGKMNATYYQTGNGSAVVENLTVDGVPSMTSVYHLDGPALRMTHYCAAQNQPRLKARQIDLAKGVLDFDFVDATNFRSPDAPHVYGLEMRLLTTDHITLAFLFEGAGKRSKELIDLKRVVHKTASQ